MALNIPQFTQVLTVKEERLGSCASMDWLFDEFAEEIYERFGFLLEAQTISYEELQQLIYHALKMMRKISLMGNCATYDPKIFLDLNFQITEVPEFLELLASFFVDIGAHEFEFGSYEYLPSIVLADIDFLS